MVVRASVVDENGAHVAGAVVSLQITTPGGGTVNLAATSDSDGIAEATYKVDKRRGEFGNYDVDVTDVERSGDSYDAGVSTTHVAFDVS